MPRTSLMRRARCPGCPAALQNRNSDHWVCAPSRVATRAISSPLAQPTRSFQHEPCSSEGRGTRWREARRLREKRYEYLWRLLLDQSRRPKDWIVPRPTPSRLLNEGAARGLSAPLCGERSQEITAKIKADGRYHTTKHKLLQMIAMTTKQTRSRSFIDHLVWPLVGTPLPWKYFVMASSVKPCQSVIEKATD